MLKPLGERKRVFFLVVVLFFLLLTGLLFRTSRDTLDQTKAEFSFKLLLYPIQRTLQYVTDFSQETWNTLTGLASLHRENADLCREISGLKMEISQLQHLVTENERLRQTLSFSTKSSLSLIPVEIVARNPSNWMDTVIIDKGGKYGLLKNMPVITEHGVVGRILDVNTLSSEVILLTDPREGNSMSGVIKRSRGLVYIYGGGPGGNCRVKSSDLDVRFEIGDQILTSESSLYFPKNLLIGTISEIIDHGDGFEQEAVMKPAAKLGQMEYIYVVSK